ncbi:hypothetical protein [Undibacterium terreum]|uniref:Uncharacterized protein n=1 Tax=Undibacterium terreum TaxID=1224302 RepID=A0A916U6N3_9BURK|nr:hypothetical protein [Undibacterium terreum]GGC61093.1 hypothetical protein GCM10011396_05090 [Undibacterium terreum]
MLKSKEKKNTEAPTNGRMSDSLVAGEEMSVPSTLEDEALIADFDKAKLEQDVQGLNEDSVATEREASLNRDEPDMALDKLDPVPPK